MRKINAITLWQPWATLIYYGFKRYETRHWQRRSLIGQYIAIHAASKWNQKLKRYTWMIGGYKPELAAILHSDIRPGTVRRLPLSAVLCVCKLVDIHPTDSIKPGDVEQIVGNWLPGRFAWELEMVEKFDTPIPAKGAQGIWKWEWDQK